MRLALAGGLLAALLAACTPAAPREDSDVRSDAFPAAHRPVAPIVSSRYSTEEARDRLREADNVMTRSGVARGMTVADIGAGEGYYTIRLAARVGEDGRVLAEDIVPEVRDALAERVNREALDNVSVRLGEPADPKLPAASFDRIFLVHMYHEIGAPYEFLWRMRPALRPGGRVVVVDSDRATSDHGTPPALLDCEMKAVGYVRVEQVTMPQAGGYLAMYEAQGPRPEPDMIKPCVLKEPAPAAPTAGNPHDR
ncbi:Methyltransferase domain-containing protein [Sphingomonas laterariae]|uniref:Methyltransferase domain-containing protein n=1 Tax=Edaphosphingomonas laterariae TaxID=861865 RepID=A0A239F1M6_9SPHN|nr:class I SAM-dependent methyltransferase [Sphingomonas laterariae]SNS50789.1 Methyltransferase domain-containing protein [Sphingomonas laterariae]